MHIKQLLNVTASAFQIPTLADDKMKFRRSLLRGPGSSKTLEQAPINGEQDACSTNYSPRSVDLHNSPYAPTRYDSFSDRLSVARAFDDVDELPIAEPPIEKDGSVRSSRSSISKWSKKDRRAASTGRAVWGEGRTEISKTAIKSPPRDTPRAKSVGRAALERKDDDSSNNLAHMDSTENSSVSQSNDVSERTDDEPTPGKKRKSKMEKIRQLQAKNELYKGEFKRVQKDRRQLKKDLESKKLEVASLTKEIDSHIAETSVLKSKLSESLQQLDRTDHDGRRDKTLIVKLSKELTESMTELKQSQERVAELLEKMNEMKETVRRKDEQIKSLTRELTEQAHDVEMLRNENTMIKRLNEQDETKERKKADELRAENEKLQTELGSTLERAAAMVKEREDAIADLLKENDEMKRLLSQQDSNDRDVSEEELNHLRAELAVSARALEETQDRNLLLEEDVEEWIRRGNEMESEIVRLRGESETWQERATAAEVTAAEAQENVSEKETEVALIRNSLKEMDAKYKGELAEMDIKLRAAQLAAEDKDTGSLASCSQSKASTTSHDLSEGQESQNQQAMLLEKVVADRQQKKSKKSGSWLFGKAGPEEELTEDQKRIKELEVINADQDEEIKKLKSDLVRLRSTHNEESYVNRKKIEKLEAANKDYERKTAELEQELAESRDFPDLLADDAKQ